MIYKVKVTNIVGLLKELNKYRRTIGAPLWETYREGNDRYTDVDNDHDAQLLENLQTTFQERGKKFTYKNDKMYIINL